MSDENLALLVSARLRAQEAASKTSTAEVMNSIRAFVADQRLAFVLHDLLGVDTTYVARMLRYDPVIVVRLIEDARAATGISS